MRTRDLFFTVPLFFQPTRRYEIGISAIIEHTGNPVTKGVYNLLVMIMLWSNQTTQYKKQ